MIIYIIIYMQKKMIILSHFSNNGSEIIGNLYKELLNKLI
uniref:Uncharacterized protein n=1 Tax=viral metagenome TaxID=1070528 RepID=A0A6C0J0G0_9ZZZZ